MKNIEIELKVKVFDTKLFDFVSKNGKFLNQKKQTDIYFDPPHKTYLFETSAGIDANEGIRVRLSDKGDYFAHKKMQEINGKQTGFVDEVETKIEDGKQVLKILSIMDCKETCRIEKHRKTYKYEDLLIEFDKINGLGEFVEIEFEGECRTPKKAMEKIKNLLLKTKTKYEIIKTGYVQLMWQKNNKPLS